MERPGEFDRFDREAGTFTHYRHDRRAPSSLSNDKIYVIFEDRQGMLWIGTDGGGLNRYDPESDAFVRYQYNPYNRHGLSQDLVTAIYEDLHDFPR